MEKMKNLTTVEEAVFKFLKTSFTQSPDKIKTALQQLLNEIKHLEKNRFQTRSFAYLDIISWAESKVYNKTMEQVVHGKYKESKRR